MVLLVIMFILVALVLGGSLIVKGTIEGVFYLIKRFADCFK